MVVPYGRVEIGERDVRAGANDPDGGRGADVLHTAQCDSVIRGGGAGEGSRGGDTSRDATRHTNTQADGGAVASGWSWRGVWCVLSDTPHG